MDLFLKFRATKEDTYRSRKPRTHWRKSWLVSWVSLCNQFPRSPLCAEEIHNAKMSQKNLSWEHGSRLVILCQSHHAHSHVHCGRNTKEMLPWWRSWCPSLGPLPQAYLLRGPVEQAPVPQGFVSSGILVHFIIGVGWKPHLKWRDANQRAGFSLIDLGHQAARLPQVPASKPGGTAFGRPEPAPVQVSSEWETQELFKKIQTGL